MNLQQIEAAASLLSTLGSVLVTVLPTLFSTVDAVVRSVEASFPTLNGTQKFNAALARLEGLYGDVVSTAPAVFGGLVNSSVAIMNAVGEFQHAKKAASSPAPAATQVSQ